MLKRLSVTLVCSSLVILAARGAAAVPAAAQAAGPVTSYAVNAGSNTATPISTATSGRDLPRASAAVVTGNLLAVSATSATDSRPRMPPGAGLVLAPGPSRLELMRHRLSEAAHVGSARMRGIW